MKITTPKATKAEISKAAALLSSLNVRTPERTAKLRANAFKGMDARRMQRKLLKDIECRCGGEGLKHKGTCQRYHAIRYRKKKGWPLK